MRRPWRPAAARQHRQSRPAGPGDGIRSADGDQQVGSAPIYRQGKGEVSDPFHDGDVRPSGDQTRFHLSTRRYESNPKLDDPQAHFGLLRNDISPTMAYHAVRNVMHLLCDDAAALNPRRLKAACGDLQNSQHLAAEGLRCLLPATLAGGGQLRKPKPSNLLQSREWTAGPRPLALTFDEAVAAVRTYLPSALDGDADEGKDPRRLSMRPPASVWKSRMNC